MEVKVNHIKVINIVDLYHIGQRQLIFKNEVKPRKI